MSEIKVGTRAEWVGDNGFLRNGDFATAKLRDGRLWWRHERRGDWCWSVLHDDHKDPAWRLLPDAPTEQGPRVPRVGDRYRCENVRLGLDSEGAFTLLSRFGDGSKGGWVLSNGGIIHDETWERWKPILVSAAPTPPVEVPPRTCRACNGKLHPGKPCLSIEAPPAPAAPPVHEKRVPVCEGQDGQPENRCTATEGLRKRRMSKLHERRERLLCDACHLGYERCVQGAQERREKHGHRFQAPVIAEKPAPWRPGDSGVAAARGAKPCWRTRGGRW